MSLKSEIERRFVCLRCGGLGASVTDLSSRVDALNPLPIRTVTCNHCGRIEEFDMGKLASGQRRAAKRGEDFLDTLFGPEAE